MNEKIIQIEIFSERQRKAQETKELLKETGRRLQEAEEREQETGRKLKVLMEVISCKEPSSPHPICSSETASSPQQTIPAQKQLQWHQFQHGVYLIKCVILKFYSYRARA